MVAAGCEVIEGATGTSYQLRPEDEGFVIRVRQTATNAFGSVTVTSEPTGIIGPAGAVILAPDEIDDLEIWLDANQLGLANNDPVSSFTDMSGNGHHGTQGTAGDRPLFKTGVINGMPALLFDGTSDWLTTNYSDVVSDFGLFIVGIVGSGSAAADRLVDKNFSFGFWFGKGLVANKIGGGVEETVDPFGIYVTAAEDAPHIFATEKTGTTHHVSTEAETTSNTVTGTGTDGSLLTIGATGTPDAWLNGHIAELAFYTRYLTADERSGLRNYFADKYGLTLAP